MDNQVDSPQKSYMLVVIFLILLSVVGGIIVFSYKKSSDSSLQTATPSATITSDTSEAGESFATPSGSPTMNTTELQIEDQKIGTGETAVPGKKVTVNYVGTLTNGSKFDSSYDRNQPFSFTLGAGEVIEGWDLGVEGMKVGGKRKLIIPPSLGYGSSDLGVIPPNSTLTFEVELLEVE